MNQDRRVLIEYRLKQADDALQEARILLDAEMSSRSVMNRLYYAMFYAVLALLQERQMGTSKHVGAIALFDREFVKTGLLSKDLSKVLHRAFELRQKGDYMEDGDVSKESIQEMLPETSSFVEKVKEYLRNRQ